MFGRPEAIGSWAGSAFAAAYSDHFPLATVCVASAAASSCSTLPSIHSPHNSATCIDELFPFAISFHASTGSHGWGRYWHWSLAAEEHMPSRPTLATTLLGSTCTRSCPLWPASGCVHRRAVRVVSRSTGTMPIPAGRKPSPPMAPAQAKASAGCSGAAGTVAQPGPPVATQPQRTVTTTAAPCHPRHAGPSLAHGHGTRLPPGPRRDPVGWTEAALGLSKRLAVHPTPSALQVGQSLLSVLAAACARAGGGPASGASGQPDRPCLRLPGPQAARARCPLLPLSLIHI